ncbi:hypothetical protein HELRODRAFT_112906 [Helobdella robusta]|uniref:Enoyl-CoA hydratase n=1 Tax=Helobdella robusta TaxID=6412 RepID=T1EFN2_HELRO|nr:hypothetical protein HELRODRAFT_112906 [Helobdella robusta]ESO01147.1 hypothetical protein HELRODRAFT_112906 [Helobdella robusta]
MLRSNSIILRTLDRLFLHKNVLGVQQKRTATNFQDEDFTLEFLENDRKGIAVGTLTRFKTKNAISKSLVKQFKDALEICKNEKKLSVLVLRSSVPGVFCAGADLKERLAMDESDIGPFVASLRQLTVDISDLPIPSIAAVDGVALGGGLEFALSCDLIIASDSAKLGLIETKLAIIPGAGGTQRLPRLIGLSAAKELIFTGRVIDGLEAHKIGVANYVVPQNTEKNAAYLKSLEVADMINSNGPIAIRMAKMAVDKGYGVDLKSGLAYEQAFYAQVIPTKDRVEALKAFKEKRPPKFIGE